MQPVDQMQLPKCWMSRVKADLHWSTLLFCFGLSQAASLCLHPLKQEYFSLEEQKSKLLKPVAPETSSATKQSADSTFQQGKIEI